MVILPPLQYISTESLIPFYLVLDTGCLTWTFKVIWAIKTKNFCNLNVCISELYHIFQLESLNSLGDFKSQGNIDSGNDLVLFGNQQPELILTQFYCVAIWCHSATMS